jgi:hypothetical protein
MIRATAAAAKSIRNAAGWLPSQHFSPRELSSSAHRKGGAKQAAEKLVGELGLNLGVYRVMANRLVSLD